MDSASKSFAFLYLSVYYLMMAGDWLQGPYVYVLYSTYGFSNKEIGILFIIGFGSSLAIGTLIGSYADSLGRKKFALLYCALYILSCFTKHFNNWYMLAIGRVLGGTATSLLFSVFESWVVCEHANGDYADSVISTIFSYAAFGNSIVAILCGTLAQRVVERFPMPGDPLSSGFRWGGYTTPFDMASLVLVIGGSMIFYKWDENYGSAKNASKKADKLTERLAQIWNLPDRNLIILCGAVQSLFEGSMYAFVFEWTPALKSWGEFKAGYIFSTFMIACMLGSQCFSILVTKMQPKQIIKGMLVLSIVSMVLPALGSTYQISFLGLIIFECCVGIYFPAMGTLKSVIVPEEYRATIYNLFRVPMNGIVLVLLVSNYSPVTTFRICLVMLIGALALHMFLCKTFTQATSESFSLVNEDDEENQSEQLLK